MARPLLLVTLILFALVAVAMADTASEAAAAAVPSFGPASDDQIGTSEDGAGAGEVHSDDSSAVAAEAPVSGPVPPGAYAFSPEAPHSGAGAVEVSAVAAVGVAIAGLFF